MIPFNHAVSRISVEIWEEIIAPAADDPSPFVLIDQYAPAPFHSRRARKLLRLGSHISHSQISGRSCVRKSWRDLIDRLVGQFLEVETNDELRRLGARSDALEEADWACTAAPGAGRPPTTSSSRTSEQPSATPVSLRYLSGFDAFRPYGYPRYPHWIEATHPHRASDISVATPPSFSLIHHIVSDSVVSFRTTYSLGANT